MNQLLESQMEDLIAQYPDIFLREYGLKLIARQFRIGNYIFDLLFEDRHGAKLIVELQRGTLNRDHCYKIFDYLDEFKSKHPNEFIDIIIVANEITIERKKMISAKGIKYCEIPEIDFIQKLQDNLQNVTSSLITVPPQDIMSKSIRENSTSKRNGPKQRIINNKYFVTSEELKELINDYIIRGKATVDKTARKKLILEILHEYLNSTDKQLSAKYLFEFIKEKQYQKDYNNSFLRLIYYPLLVSDELFEGKSLAEKIFYDVAVPGNPKYPNFKILETEKYDLNKINLRVNFPTGGDYRNTLSDIIAYTKSIGIESF